MNTRRIIPSLLLMNGGLYKTTNFKNPSYVGDPINAIKIFNEKEVDELMVLDIEASKLKKNPDYSLIESFASECFMPLTYGGGIKSLKQAEKLFSLGVEKILVQTSVLENHNFLHELIQSFGSSSIVASIDIKKNFFNKFKIYSHSKIKNHGFSSLEKYIDLLNQYDVGEVLLNDVDRDGQMQGQNKKLINYVANKLKSPMISLGGIGSFEDIKESFDSGASAVAAGAFFVYHGPHRAVLINYPDPKTISKITGL